VSRRRGRPAPPDPHRPHPELWERPELRVILAERDTGALFGQLQRQGFSQRRIASLVGMSQSEISEIKGGRRVIAYDVHLRVAEGLGVPLVYMGLAQPPPLRERAEPASDTNPEPATAESVCLALRFVAAVLYGDDGPADIFEAQAAQCDISPCAARLLAALTAGPPSQVGCEPSTVEAANCADDSDETPTERQPVPEPSALTASHVGAGYASG
jgi:transcriptional regulator with XRE-family HTH domain